MSLSSKDMLKLPVDRVFDLSLLNVVFSRAADL